MRCIDQNTYGIVIILDILIVLYNIMIICFFVVIECEKIDNLTDPNLRIAVLSRQVGGEIMFSCMQGFGLDGPTHSTCLPTGEWEQPFPTCAGPYNTINKYNTR